MLTTRTGNFPIGFRRGWSDWQKNLDNLIVWAQDNNLGVIDLGSNADVDGARLAEAGIRIGSADLREWSGLISSDPGKRKAARDANAEYLRLATSVHAKNFFAVLLPEDPGRSRADNEKDAIAGLTELTPLLAEVDAYVVLEGWPGPGALATTPESYRRILDAVDSKHVGINYDPSHLIRMGVDPIRFLREFVTRVHHVHGKDTEIITENIYEYGTEVAPTSFNGFGFGGSYWRYTIPGHGQTRWTEVFRILVDNGYNGAVSIELEDENFNGTEAGEKAGILAGATFLASA